MIEIIIAKITIVEFFTRFFQKFKKFVGFQSKLFMERSRIKNASVILETRRKYEYFTLLTHCWKSNTDRYYFGMFLSIFYTFVLNFFMLRFSSYRNWKGISIPEQLFTIWNWNNYAMNEFSKLSSQHPVCCALCKKFTRRKI